MIVPFVLILIMPLSVCCLVVVWHCRREYLQAESEDSDSDEDSDWDDD